MRRALTGLRRNRVKGLRLYFLGLLAGVCLWVSLILWRTRTEDVPFDHTVAIAALLGVITAVPLIAFYGSVSHWMPVQGRQRWAIVSLLTCGLVLTGAIVNLFITSQYDVTALLSAAAAFILVQGMAFYGNQVSVDDHEQDESDLEVERSSLKVERQRRILYSAGRRPVPPGGVGGLFLLALCSLIVASLAAVPVLVETEDVSLVDWLATIAAWLLASTTFLGGIWFSLHKGSCTFFTGGVYYIDKFWRTETLYFSGIRAIILQPMQNPTGTAIHGYELTVQFNDDVPDHTVSIRDLTYSNDVFADRIRRYIPESIEVIER